MFDYYEIYNGLKSSLENAQNDTTQVTQLIKDYFRDNYSTY